MLVEKIYDVLKNKSAYKASEEGLAVLSAGYAQAIKKQILGTGPEHISEKQYLAPSRATKCVRQSFYKHQGTIAEPMAPRSSLTFLWGDLTEATLLFLVRHCGVQIVGTQEPISIRVSASGRMKGFTDFRMKSKKNDKTVIGEVKSMSGFTFKSFKTAMENSLGIPDAFGYEGQVHAYLRGALEAGDIDPPGWGVMLAFNKDTGHLYEGWVKYDPDVMLLVDSNYDILEAAVSKGQVPARMASAGGGNRLILEPVSKTKTIQRNKVKHKVHSHYELPIQCQYCSHKYPCWEGRLPTGYSQDEMGNCTPIWGKGDKPKKHKITLEFGKDRFGSGKPVWKIAEV